MSTATLKKISRKNYPIIDLAEFVLVPRKEWELIARDHEENDELDRYLDSPAYAKRLAKIVKKNDKDESWVSAETIRAKYLTRK